MKERKATDLLNKIIVMEKDKQKSLCLITGIDKDKGIIEVLDLDNEKKIIIGFFDVIEGNISFRILS